MAEDSNEFYCDTFFVKVEDRLFCLHQCEFVQSSDVFADMFLLPSGPATREGQDKDHPIVLEGYKKDEFACLLKVMFPRASSLISGSDFELSLTKEEWVSVLKLSTIWDMTKIRQYAIHRLSTDVTLPPIEKIFLARAHRVGVWLDEAITSLATCNPMPKLEDLATLGWETVARIFWIRDNFPRNLNALDAPDTLSFRRDAIKCAQCSTSSSLIDSSYGCGHIASGDAQLTFSGSSSLVSGSSIDRLVPFRQIQCLVCRGNPFQSIYVTCDSCSYSQNNYKVRVTPYSLKTIVEQMFGEEIKDEPSLPDSA